jgi:hypothetical protein
MESPWFDCAQASAYVGLSVHTLAAHRHAKTDPKFTTLSDSKLVRYHSSWLDDWLEQRAVSARPKVKRIDKRPAREAVHRFNRHFGLEA